MMTSRHANCLVAFFYYSWVPNCNHSLKHHCLETKKYDAKSDGILHISIFSFDEWKLCLPLTMQIRRVFPEQRLEFKLAFTLRVAPKSKRKWAACVDLKLRKIKLPQVIRLRNKITISSSYRDARHLILRLRRLLKNQSCSLLNLISVQSTVGHYCFDYWYSNRWSRS